MTYYIPNSHHASINFLQLDITYLQVIDSVCGRQVSKLKLANALVQPNPRAMALKLMACLFTKEELVNGNPSGETSSKSEQRKRTIQKLDTSIMGYIEGKCAGTIYTCTLLVTHDDKYLYIQMKLRQSGRAAFGKCCDR